jgi:streptomycin 6-kinase
MRIPYAFFCAHAQASELTAAIEARKNCRGSSKMIETLPAYFIQNNLGSFEEEGERWLHALPDLLAEYAERWSLTIHPHFPGLSYNYVAPATLPDGREVVFKAGVVRDEVDREIEALRWYAGQGMVKLIQAEPTRGVMLLERIHPGEWLTGHADDDAATQIAAEVMAQLFRPLPADHPFEDVAAWARDLDVLRLHFDGGTGPISLRLVEMAERFFAELLASSGSPVLIHGDLHHYNILSHGDGWIGIDPKGMAGEAEYEAGSLLRNPEGLHTWPDLPKIQERRVEILCDRLGFDRPRVVRWSIAQAVLSGWWTIDSGGDDWQTAIACAESLIPLL